MPDHHITIYSSGIAEIQRAHAIPQGEPTKIALTVKREHIGDVLGSLNVFGPVTLVSPPVYAPVNESQGNLTIDPHNAIEDLAVRLRGSKVQIKRAADSLTGTLVGLHEDSEATERAAVSVKSLVLLTDDGMARVPLRDIQRLQFLDEVAKAELDKALVRAFRDLTPDSTTVEFALAADEANAEAIVQYTVPAAAWKISYRLREQDGDYEFQGFAIVDNHTDADWNDVFISVVTGEPITFSTDLATTKLPARDHVDLVQARALGAREVEETMDAMEMVAGGGAAAYLSAAAPASPPAFAKRRASASVQHLEEVSLGAGPPPAAAQMPAGEARDVGDFAIFRSATPVSIPAHRSSLVPMFSVALAKTRSILFYKQADHPQRAFRAIEFSNTTPHSLGRGVCAILIDDTFMGSCILPATSPGGDALLVHALETGVRFQPELKTFRTELVGIRVTEGACILRRRSTAVTHLRIASQKDETFKVVVDHTFRLTQPQLSATLHRTSGGTPLAHDAKLKAGARFTLELAAREQVEFVISESRIDGERVSLIESKKQGEELKTSWLFENLLASDGPLSNASELRQLVDLRARLDAIHNEVAKVNDRIQKLTQRQERLRKNIAAGGQDEQTASWRVELGTSEKQIGALEDQTLPQLAEQEKAAREELRQALLSLALEWTEESISH